MLPVHDQLVVPKWFRFLLLNLLILQTIDKCFKRCLVYAVQIQPTPTPKRKLDWRPSRVSFEQVTYKYPPETIWRRVSSSIPRREVAIDDLTISFESEFRLVVGASSSGKSTLLELILGKKDFRPQTGTIQISSLIQAGLGGKESACPASDASTIVPSSDYRWSTLKTAQPILLNERPNFHNNCKSVGVILKETLLTCLRKYGIQTKGNERVLRENILLDILLQDIVVDVLEVVIDQNPSQFSPSENYKFAFAVACLQSIMSEKIVREYFLSVECKEAQDASTFQLPAPIVLLDEWMDTETSAVIHNVQDSMKKWIHRGAVIVCVTHRPNRYKGLVDGLNNKSSKITLCRGSLLNTDISL